MQEALILYWSWAVQFLCLLQEKKKKVVISFAFVRPAPSIPAASFTAMRMRWSWVQTRVCKSPGASGTHYPAACSWEQLLHQWGEQQGLGSNHSAVFSRPCSRRSLETLWHRTNGRWLLFCKGDIVSDCTLWASSRRLLLRVSSCFSGGSYYVGVPGHSMCALWKK